MAVSPKMIDAQEQACREIDRIDRAFVSETDPGRVRVLVRQLVGAVRRLPGCANATSVVLPPHIVRLLAAHR